MQNQLAVEKRISWPEILGWYIAMLGICIVTAYLHDVVFTSPIWEEWAKLRSATTLIHLTRFPADSLRAASALVASLFALYMMDAVTQGKRRIINRRELGRFEFAVTSAAISSALLIAFGILPLHFYADLVQLVQDGKLPPYSAVHLGEIYKVYFPYSFYVMALWLGMAFPVALFFARSIRADREQWKADSKQMPEVASFDQPALDELMGTWYKRFRILKEVATHYVAVLVPLTFLIVLEEKVFQVAASQFAERSGYAALSLMLLPALVTSLFVFGILYAIEFGRVKKFLETVDEETTDKALKSNISQKIFELEKDYSLADFFKAVLKNKNCVMIIIAWGINFSFVVWVPLQVPHWFPPQQTSTAAPPSPRPSTSVP